MREPTIYELLTILAITKNEQDSSYGKQCSLIIYNDGQGRVDIPYTSLSGEREICLFGFNNERDLRECLLTSITETIVTPKLKELRNEA